MPNYFESRYWESPYNDPFYSHTYILLFIFKNLNKKIICFERKQLELKYSSWYTSLPCHTIDVLKWRNTGGRFHFSILIILSGFHDNIKLGFSMANCFAEVKGKWHDLRISLLADSKHWYKENDRMITPSPFLFFPCSKPIYPEWSA